MIWPWLALAFVVGLVVGGLIVFFVTNLDCSRVNCGVTIIAVRRFMKSVTIFIHCPHRTVHKNKSQHNQT